jgi:ribonuclease HI
MKEIIAYTDGSAVVAGVNKGKGGFGTYFPDLFGEKKAFSLGFKQGKTGQMEVMALLYAIRAIPEDCKDIKLIVYSDSEYVVKTFTENRLFKWIDNGWKNAGGQTPKNLELWKQINHELMLRQIAFEMRHIRSHQVEKEKNIFKKKLLLKDPHIIGNMVADALADYKRHKNLI